MFPDNSGPKRTECNLGYLKILLAPRNAYNCNAKDTAQKEVAKSKFPSGNDKPDNIKYERTGAAIVDNLLTKGIERN